MNKQPLDFALAFGSAVHDVKNSVGLLLHSLDEFMKVNPPETDEDKNRAVVLNYEASRINNDMMQLLSIYRLENQRLFLSVEEVMVAEFLEDEMLAHDTLLRMKNLTVEIECDEDLHWYFDPMLIKNVLNNVIVNTIRYTKDRLRIVVESLDGYIRITVEDNGRGFPAELCQDPGGYLTRINFNTGSTGLGLYFSARVAELHKNGDREGRIEVDNNSALGGGAFRIYIP
ncbi:MAG: sensor histidine kinase [Pseudohongiellaceae bacterium]